MRKYSIPRQIWRVIYPLLIFVGVQLIVVFVATIAYGVVLGVQAATGGVTLDLTIIQVLAEEFLFDYNMWFMLASSVIGILIFALMWRKERTYIPLYDNTKLKPLPAVLMVLLFAGLNFILLSVVGLTNLIQHFPSYEQVVQLLSGGSLVLRILVVGLLAPVAEELLCRGLVLNRLFDWMPKWAAALVGSALFGIVHFNLFQALYAFVLGIMFSLLYIRHRNLLMPIIAHVAFNLANVILIEVLEAAGVEEFSAWLLLISSFLVAAVCIALLLKHTKASVLIQESKIEKVIDTEG